ncbi:MAG TPA: hypothetical protein VE755_01605 [Myxococcales bacterium]|nr:hypothetical protein [Myxococcales bacterium]
MALFLPAWSAQQALYAASFGVALVVVGVYGGVVARRVLGVPSVGPWTAVYLGQFALLAGLNLLMPLNGLLARWAGMSLPLTALVAPPAIVLGVVTFRRRPPSAPVFEAPLLGLLGLGSMALVLSIYSRDISALGLDLHEHVAWVRQIVTRGFVPLAEPSTRILGDYPRTFHIVGALWDAAGFGLPGGPFVKVMPFLQNALPLLAIAEQLVRAGAAQPGASRPKLEVTLGLAFFLYAFLVVPLVYPVRDLLGTPRFSSDSILLLPIALLLIGRVRNAPQASALALTSVPLVAAWALTWNPIILVLLAVVTGPVLAAFSIFLRPPPLRGVSGRARASALVACAALALLSLAQDPWVVSVGAQKLALVRGLTHRAGLMTFDEAVGLALATPREKSVLNHPASPPCADAACVLGKAVGAARSALSLPWISAAAATSDAIRIAGDPSLPNQKDAFKGAFLLQPASIADYAGLPFFVWIVAGVLVGTRRSVRRRTLGDEARLLLASVLGLAAAGIALSFASGLAAALSDQRHESIILYGYLGISGAHVTLALLWLPFAGATLVLAHPLLHRASVDAASSPRRLATTGIGLAIWLALPLLGRLNLHRPLQHRGFWTRIGIEDVHALREVEKAIPPDDGVIIPAEHATFTQWEHWVLPLGETAALLPYGERRYLFNVYLGASYPLSWRDLTERLCSKDPAIRASFYQRTRARWVLIRDQSGADAAAVVNQPWPRVCSVSFAALGAELPAVAERKGIFLFRLRAPPIESQRPPQ